MSKHLRKLLCYSSSVGSTWCIVWPKLCVVWPTHCSVGYLSMAGLVFSRNSQNFPSHVSIPNIPLLSTFITERQNDPKSSNKCLRLNALSLIRPQCIGHVYHVCQVNWHVRRPCHDTLTRGWKVGSVFTVQHTPPLSDHTSHSSQTVHHQFVRRGRSNQKDLALK